MGTKQNWIMPLVTALVVACVGWWADRQLHQVMQEELTGDLETMLGADVTALEIWMANQKRIAAMLAEEPRLRNLAVELLGRGGERATNRMELAGLARQLIVGDRLQARLSSLGYTVAQLVNTNFEVVLDSGRARSRMGTQVAEDLQPRFAELFASGEPIIITPFKIQAPGRPGRLPGGRGPGRPRGPFPPGPGPGPAGAPPTNAPAVPRTLTVMQVAAPLKDTNGVTRGAFALIINPDAEFTRMLSVARSDQTGETFAFDPEGVMISKSRFEGWSTFDGLNLAEFVEAYGAQPEGRVVNLLIQVCESLAEAHASGLIHRDIKPANIFVTDRGGVPDMVKVLDFGLVRPVVSADGAVLDAADTEIMAGTPSYMSPEAFENGANADARSDLYSVGAVGYYLLTGHGVFDGETVAEICRKRMEEEPVPPTARAGRPICPHLVALILRCLERDPKDRPQSAHELIAQLAASPRIADWNVEQRAAWWVAHREAINRARAAEAEPIETAKAVDIEIEDRTP